MRLYRDQGVVLRTIRLGEADRIVNLMTEGRGKVRAVAKGIRKTRSRFGARLEPTVHVSLMLHEGRELDVVTAAEAIDPFRPIREDLGRIAQATRMLEAVDHVAQERQANPALYRMIVGALRALAVVGAGEAPLVAPAFFWKLLALEGSLPVLDRCAACDGSEESIPLVSFDLLAGGALCRSCAREGLGMGRPVSPEAFVMVRRILGGDLGRILSGGLGAPSPALAREVERLATHALEQHLERRLRSLTFLD
ncbi:MAG: DNA repair protein RecO [Acidimicrobiales bacterium]